MDRRHLHSRKRKWSAKLVSNKPASTALIVKSWLSDKKKPQAWNAALQ
jgi:hypothetical protein